MITFGPNRELMSSLIQGGARFLIIGSTAVRFHAPNRAEPNDLDVVVEPSADGLKQLNVALSRVGAPLVLATPDEFGCPNKGFRQKTVCNIDVFTPITGLNFADHWAAGEEATMAFSSTVVRVASKETLTVWLRHAMNVEPTRRDAILKDLQLLEDQP